MNNQLILSQIEEVTSELGEPDCKLTEPFVVTTSDQKITLQEGMMVLAPWLLNVTNQNTFMISSDKILTIVDPNTKLTKKYEEMLDKE
tara:strand:+ start:275 stop:538 length:264 start_codon:yes stop_codon:yes gene_type:complete